MQACSSPAAPTPQPTAAATTKPAPAPAQTSAAQPAPAATPAPTQAPAKVAQPYAGTLLKLAQVPHPYAEGLTAGLPDFKKKTGIDVQIDTMAFPVLNQRADLELSSGSGAYDVMQMIFIRAGRWIGAGWVEPLTPYIEDATLTDKKELALDDFLPGALVSFQSGGNLFALPWLADSIMTGYRKDIFAKGGYDTFPDTFDKMYEAFAKIHTSATAATVQMEPLHFSWPVWLQAYGGNFFADPPNDLTPTFNTPEAIKSAELFITALTKYSPPGAVNPDASIGITMMRQGKAASLIHGFSNVGQTLDATKTEFAAQLEVGPVPAGPKGAFPQLAVHGYLINKASKNKKAAWEFVKWATSKEMMLSNALDRGHIATTRSSVLANADVRKKFRYGNSDIPALHEAVLKRAGTGYMAYRTVPFFPPIGDRVVQALTGIASGQKKLEEEMKALQKDAETILEKEGVKIRKTN